MVSFSAVVCFVVVTVATATDVQQCKGRNVSNLSENVDLIPCSKIPCKLKKGTEEKIVIGFTPESDVDIVKNLVTAKVLELDLPFVGVDGISVCDKIFTEDGASASCPLKAGTKYFYKDSFPILSLYPSLRTRVHWELLDEAKRSLVCFEVDARIA